MDHIIFLQAKNLIDGDGRELREGVGVLVANGKIAAADSLRSLTVPTGAKLIDLGDMTILPGLIDMHVHLSGRRGYGMADRVLNSRDFRVLRAAEDCESLLRAGYTTVRDVGSEIALSLRKAITAGVIRGPRVVAAGPIISQTGGHADHHFLPLSEASEFEGIILADGIHECRKAVRAVVRSSADLVKICTTGGIGSERDHPWDSHYTVDEVAVMVEEAHRLGRSVAAHAQGRDGILTALRGGVDSIEHGTYLDEECVELMLRHGTTLVPTVALRGVFIRSLEGQANDMPPWRLRKQEEAIPAIEKGFRMAISHGVPIACGSDFTGVPFREHGNNAAEPIAMVELGFSPQRAISAATAVAAKALGMGGLLGCLKEGANADIIAVQNDPFEDISELQRVQFVMKDGIVAHFLHE